MKQSRSSEVGIYLQIQLHHQRIRAQCCSWGKTDKLSLLFLTRSPTENSFRLSAGGCNAEVFFSPASKILEIVASLASTCPRPELAIFCTCKQTIINCKYWVFRSLTCSAQRQVHLLHQESHQTHQSPAVSSWARRAAVVLPIGSDFLRLLSTSTDFWFAK